MPTSPSWCGQCGRSAGGSCAGWAVAFRHCLLAIGCGCFVLSRLARRPREAGGGEPTWCRALWQGTRASTTPAAPITVGDAAAARPTGSGAPEPELQPGAAHWASVAGLGRVAAHYSDGRRSRRRPVGAGGAYCQVGVWRRRAAARAPPGFWLRSLAAALTLTAGVLACAGLRVLGCGPGEWFRCAQLRALQGAGAAAPC